MKRYFVLAHTQAREGAAKACLDAPEGYVVTIAPPTRNLEQNARMWAMLNEISAQVVWYGSKLSQNEWKIFFTAILKGQKAVPNLDGNGFVVLGVPTSNMSKSDMSDLLTLMEAFGAEHDVKFEHGE